MSARTDHFIKSYNIDGDRLDRDAFETYKILNVFAFVDLSVVKNICRAFYWSGSNIDGTESQVLTLLSNCVQTIRLQAVLEECSKMFCFYFPSVSVSGIWTQGFPIVNQTTALLIVVLLLQYVS